MTVAKYQQPTQDGRRPSESAPVIYKNKLGILHEAGGATLIKLQKVPIKLLSFNFFPAPAASISKRSSRFMKEEIFQSTLKAEWNVRWGQSVQAKEKEISS